MFCEHCGSRIEPGVTHCPTCGKLIPAVWQQQAPVRARRPATQPAKRSKPATNPRWEALWKKLDQEKTKKTALIAGSALGGVSLLVLLIGYL